MLINIEDTNKAVTDALSPLLQQANLDAENAANEAETKLSSVMMDATNAASAAATQHQADLDTIAALRKQIQDGQPTPPPPLKQFLIGVSNGPTATAAKSDADRNYYNNTEVAKLLSDAETTMKAGKVPLLSIKPYGTTSINNWASIGTGSGDKAWVLPLLDGLEALCVKYKIMAYLSVHHEPDDEIVGGWKASDFVAMQMHIATLAVARPHIKYGVVTMGYHQWEKTDVPMSTVVPAQLAALLDYVGFDPYDENGKKDWSTYISKIKSWIAQSGNPKLEFGVLETGTTAATYVSHPHWMHDASGAWKTGGASFWTYWNSIVKNKTGAVDWRMNSAMITEFQQLVTEN